MATLAEQLHELKSYDTVTVRKGEGIGEIILNRPEKLNPLGKKMMTDLQQAITVVADDAEIKVVVITGAGRAFSAGGDIEDMRGGAFALSREEMRSMHTWMMHLANLDKPVIAMVNGVAAGVGVNLALMCDIIVASDKASFIQAFVNIGLVPDFGGLWSLPRAVGTHKAKELMMLGDPVTADEALRIGLVNRVVPADQLEPTVRELALRLSKQPQRSVRMIKSIVDRGYGLPLDTVLEWEAEAQDICGHTEDFVEGTTAFLEKRKAVFKGR